MVIFEPIARWLLFGHYVTAVVALGTAIHLAVRVVGRCRGSRPAVQVEQLHARLLLWSYAACFLTGALVYPTFRVRVRYELFDESLPWATAMFEIKEHWASVGLVAVIAIWLLARALPGEPGNGSRRYLPLYAGLLAIVLGILGYNTWSGWYLTLLKAV